MFKLAPISAALALLSMLMLNACGTELHLSDGLAQDSSSAEMTSGAAKKNRQKEGTDFGSAVPDASGEKGEHGQVFSTNCDDTTAGFFAQQVWGGFMAARCAQCHSAGGMAQYSFAFEESLSPASIQHNLETLQNLASFDYTFDDGTTMPYLLAKPQGLTGYHGGGVVINEFDHPSEIENLTTLIDILRADDVVLDEVCETDDAFDGVEIANLPTTYRKAALLLGSRVPTADEHQALEEAEDGSEAELDFFLDELLTSEQFYDNLMLWFNDRLFTDKYVSGYDAVKALDNPGGVNPLTHYPQARYFYKGYEDNQAYQPAIAPQTFFRDRVLPIFDYDPDGEDDSGPMQSCTACHSSEEPAADLNLSTYQSICDAFMVEPGNHENSGIWDYVDSLDAHMDTSLIYSPDAEEVALVEEWINTYQACHADLADGTLDNFWTSAKSGTSQGIGREPLKLIKHVVKNNRHFGEILSADYALVNSYSAVAYDLVDLRASEVAYLYDGVWNFETPDEGPCGEVRGCDIDPLDAVDNFNQAMIDLGFEDWLNPEIYQEKQITVATGDMIPHAGVLTTNAYLMGFPTTSANKNRHRTSHTLRNFLGLDLYEYIPPPSIPPTSDDDDPTSNDPACFSCHSKMDSFGELFRNWNNLARYADNHGTGEWQTDFNAGYFGENFDGDGQEGTELQWLAEKITQDPRFGKAMASILFEQLLGRTLKAPTPDVLAPDYEEHFAAYQHEQLFLEEMGARFLDDSIHNGNIRGLIKDIIKSSYFRAVSAGTSQASDIFLSGVNAGFLLTPEGLNAKNMDTFGLAWKIGSTNGLTSTYNLLYGGINSRTVLNRQRMATALSANVLTMMALELPKKLGDAGLLEGLWEVSAAAGEDASDDDVRADIQNLFVRLLGEHHEPYADEISYAFDNVYTVVVSSELDIGDKVVAARKAVLSYLLMDYNYTHSDLLSVSLQEE